MPDIVRQRRDTAANWTANNPILFDGQLGFETDTLAFKIGNGATAWNSLLYVVSPSGQSFPIAAAGGTVDAITANYTPDISLTDKTLVAVVALGANTVTNPTFNPDGLGALTITKNGGQPLVAGDIPGALAVFFLEYNLANTRWELVDVQGDTLVTEGALINSATSKATPVDADYIGLMDSAAANILKKLSWTNVKVTLKAYFDTVYQSLASFAADVRAVVITGFSSGAGTVAATDTILQAFNKIDGNANAALAIPRTILQGSLLIGQSNTVLANTYYLTAQQNAGPNTTNTTSGAATVLGPAAVYINSADYPAINGKSPKLRVNAKFFVNATAPGQDFVFDLRPITAPVSAGAVGTRSHTIGSQVSGSNATQASIAANTNYAPVSGWFTLPADGWYALCFTTAGNLTANSTSHSIVSLELHYE